MGLLDSGPYANYDPKRDRYLQRQQQPSLGVSGPGLLNSPVANAVKIMGADLGGLAGDALELTGGPQVFPTSDQIAGAVGADRMTPSGLIGTVAGPGPAEFKGLLGALKNAVVGGGGAGLLNHAMTLFHGTPHKFDVFDLSKIGTGEGAQAYGHGLYFAENPGVAGSYRDTLSHNMGAKINGEVIKPKNDDIIRAIREIDDDASLRSKMSSYVRQYSDNPYADTPTAQRIIDAIDSGTFQRGTQGHLYEVDIPDETIDRMLDWDAPLSEQPESVQRALAKYAAGDDPTLQGLFADGINTEMLGVLPNSKGSQIYRTLAESAGGEANLSKALNEAGIPGIRYLDGQSRRVPSTPGDLMDAAKKAGYSNTQQYMRDIDAGIIDPPTGTRNIVVFDPNDIRQVKRDGELVYKSKGL